jgi:glycosyltransferase involved in cell wall biosynthesis
MGPFAILCPALSQADAVGHDVLGMERALRSWGHEVRIFAKAWDADWPRVSHFTKIFRYLRGKEAVLIYHHAVGWREGLQIVAECGCRRVIKYHNVTPAEHFYGLHCDFYYGSWLGRQQLNALARSGCDLYLADSAYNLGELLREGAPPAESLVVPPFHVTDRLLNAAINPELASRYADGVTNIFTVGRLVPNKNHRALIDAFAAYHFDYNRCSRLLIVGKEDPRLSSYAQAVRAHVEARGLRDAVIFAGGVSTEDLRTYYGLSHVFAMTSAHEGFSVPVVEAMALGLPIAAFGSSAVPETIGSAGMICPKPEARLLTEAIHRLVGDEELRREYSERGRLRYLREFTNEKTSSRLSAAIDRLGERPRRAAS